MYAGHYFGVIKDRKYSEVNKIYMYSGTLPPAQPFTVYIYSIYCRVPAGWGLQQTTHGSGQRQDTGPWILKEIKKEERTIHQTRFTKIG